MRKIHFESSSAAVYRIISTATWKWCASTDHSIETLLERLEFQLIPKNSQNGVTLRIALLQLKNENNLYQIHNMRSQDDTG